MVITKETVPQILSSARNSLETMPDAKRLDLQINSEESRLDSDYFYLCIYPAAEGIRPYDYAEVLNRVEENLHDEGYDNVVVIPGFYD